MIAVLMLALGQNFPQTPQIPIPTDVELSTAVQIYRKYGLPLPPQRFEYVKIPTSISSRSSTNGQKVQNYIGAFRFKDSATDGFVYLHGLKLTRKGSPNAWLLGRIGNEEAVTLHEFLEIDDRSSFGSYFRPDINLATGLQLASAGEKDAAIKMVTRSESFFRTPVKGSLKDRTYGLIARFAFEQYGMPDANVGEVVEMIREIYDDLPGEKNGEIWYGTERWIADSILLAHAPTNSRPGSDDALIDGLVNYGVTDEDMFLSVSVQGDPFMRRVIIKGKAIIPALIAHMDDERATRSRPDLINMDSPHFETIGDLCTEIIGSLSSSRQVNRGSLIGTTAEEWWEKAKSIDEEALLIRAIFFHEEDAMYDGDLTGAVSLNRVPLEIYNLRYPNKLGALYQESLDNPQNTNGQLAVMIDESKLSDNRKAELFKDAVERGNSEHITTAVWYLKKYDIEAAREAIRAVLESEKPFGTSDREASSLAKQVLDMDDSELAKLLFNKAIKEDSGVRINVVSGIYEGRWRAKNKNLQLIALRLFLDDATIHTTFSQRMRARERSFGTVRRWDPSDLWQFENPVAVRDYAAWCIGRLIEFPIEPQKEWRAEDWANYTGMILVKLKELDGGTILFGR